MTVAAVVLTPPLEQALRPVGGVAAIRRIADVAWAGGAFPIVIVPEADDSTGVSPEPAAAELAAPLSGAPGTVIAEWAEADGAVSRLGHGVAVARAEVDGTDAVLVWPGRSVHVDAETVTSLIEAHGVDPAAVLVPSYDGTPGWPILVPIEAAETVLRPSEIPLAELLAALRGAGRSTKLIELGDPGIVHDIDTASAELPAFEGPPAPVGAFSPDWGERVPAADPSPAPPRAAR